MSDPFVGFSQSPKPNPNAKSRKLVIELRSELPIKELLARFCSQPGFESLFGATKKFDFRQGAKLSFTLGDREFRGTISQINIPKRIVVNTEIHGEIETQFKARGNTTDLKVIARSYVTDEELLDWELVIGNFENSLKVI